MKFYRVSVFDEDCLLFWFTVVTKNYSEVLSEIEKYSYMTDLTFSNFEIMEI